MIYNANKWQSINKTNQESKCTYSCAGQKLTTLFSIHFLIKLFSLTFSLLYKTPSGYCTSIASQVRVTLFNSKTQGIYTKLPSLFHCVHNWNNPVCFLSSTMFTMWTKFLFTMWTVFRNHNSCSQWEQFFRNAHNLCSQCERSYTGSHVTLHMIDFACNVIMT